MCNWSVMHSIQTAGPNKSHPVFSNENKIYLAFYKFILLLWFWTTQPLHLQGYTEILMHTVAEYAARLIIPSIAEWLHSFSICCDVYKVLLFMTELIFINFYITGWFNLQHCIIFCKIIGLRKRTFQKNLTK